MKNAKRVLAILLCIVMCISLLPVPAMAEGTITIAEDGIISITEEEKALTELPETEEEQEDESAADEAEEEASETGKKTAAEGLEKADSQAQESVEKDNLANEEAELKEESEITDICLSSSGTCGDNLTWTLDDNGTLTISGTGAMDDFTWDGAPWSSQRSSIRAAVVESGVTTLGDYAFNQCSKLSSVTLPEGLTTIGRYAFYCSGITELELPDSVQTIKAFSIWSCYSLQRVSIGSAFSNVEEGLFESCPALTEITVSPENTALRCKDRILFSADGTVLYYYFKPSSTQEYAIPDGVVTVFPHAFCDRGASLRKITMPDSLITIGEYAFDGCSGLTEVTIGKNVETIGSWAFRGCNAIKSIYIPASVKKMNTSNADGNAISAAYGITDVNVDPGNTVYSSVDGVLFNKEKTTLIWYPTGKTASHYEIPASVNYIDFSAFYRCQLTQITIPETVSYMSCSFENCEKLTKITILAQITSLDGFYGCTNLKEISIPASVTRIEDMAFSQCTSLTDVYFAGTKEQWAAITIEEYNDCLTNATIHYNSVAPGDDVDSGECGENLNWVLNDKGTLTIYGSGVMSDYENDVAPWFTNRTSIKKLVIEDGVTSIGSNAFSNCSKLEKAIIPASVVSIGNQGFFACSSLDVVYYAGSEEEWKAISVGDLNNDITGATVYYFCSGESRIGNTATSYDGYFRFPMNGESSDNAEICSYNDSFFDESGWGSKEYNHNLARMSLSMALAAFNSSGTKGSSSHVDVSKYSWGNSNSTYDLKKKPPKNIIELMRNCGFTQVTVNEDYLLTTDYSSVNDGNNIGVCIGAKKLADDSILIAVAVRGGGYGDEWIGNFNVYNPNGYNYHVGFNRAANKVVSELKNYIDTNEISGKIKVWICGYSRGAATANLAAGKIADGALNSTGCTLVSSDLYGYMFETPQGTKITNAEAEKYAGIWNIINPIDPVPYVAMDDWGYTHYGHILYLPSNYRIPIQYDAYCDEVLGKFNNYMGKNYTSIPQMKNQYWELIKLTCGLAVILETDGSYATNVFATAIQEWFKDGFGKGAEITAIASSALGLFLSNPVLFLAGGGAVAGYGAYKHIQDVFKAHYPELTLAWMNTIPAEMVTSGGIIRFAVSNCPVDLAVYANDVLQMRFVNDEVIYEDGSYIEGSVDADGQKVVCIPPDIEVRMEIEATGDGEFNYSVQEYDISTNSVTRVVNYYEVEISEGDTLQSEISTVQEGEYLLYGDDDVVITPSEDLSGGEVEEHIVSVTAEGNGTAIGSAKKVRGEFAQVTATPDDGAEFLGWYNGEELVSEEAEYRFLVMEDVTLIAKFTTVAPEIIYTLSETELTLVIGKGRLLKLTDEEGNDVTPEWSSSDEEVAFVSSKGVVTAKKAGKAVITATVDNIELTCDVRVQFKDVTDSSLFYYEPIYNMVDKGVIGGWEDGTFRPTGNCNRAAVVTFLWKLAGRPEPSKMATFSDMTTNADFNKAISWAAEQGITSGWSDNTFRPWNTCNRAAIVTFLWRYAGKPEPTAMAAFSDMTDNEDFNNAISWAAEKGITTGWDDNTFRPWNTCNRLAVASFLDRYDKLG